jgi:hypothetical protein
MEEAGILSKTDRRKTSSTGKGPLSPVLPKPKDRCRQITEIADYFCSGWYSARKI